MVWYHESYRIMHKGVTQFNKCTRSVKHILSHHICMPGLIRTSYEHAISFSEMLYPCLSLDIVVVSICNRGAAGVHISWISKRALCGTEDIVLEWISCSLSVSFFSKVFFFRSICAIFLAGELHRLPRQRKTGPLFKSSFTKERVVTAWG